MALSFAFAARIDGQPRDAMHRRYCRESSTREHEAKHSKMRRCQRRAKIRGAQAATAPLLLPVKDRAYMIGGSARSFQKRERQ